VNVARSQAPRGGLGAAGPGRAGAQPEISLIFRELGESIPQN
jgi:hypothetical protein